MANYLPSSLTTIVITGGVLNKKAFKGCKYLTHVTILDGVVNIPYNNFDDCALESLVLPASIQSIADGGCFNKCTETEIYYAGTKEQWLKIRNRHLEGKLVHCSDGDVTE